MVEPLNIISVWTQQLEKGMQPSSNELLDHLAAIHDNNAGFTETVAWNCRDQEGKNSYELLADIIDLNHHYNVLDIACGSGVLLDLCNKRFGNKINLKGVDMNNSELKLASKKLIDTNIKLYCGVAQDLGFIDDSSADIIFCHWALNLMDPIEPVLRSVKRILRKNGVFAAIIEGDINSAPAYFEINELIYKHVRKEYPSYGKIELGDKSVKSVEELKKLAYKIFKNINISSTPFLLSFKARPNIMAKEVAGFFYASFVLSEIGYRKMLNDLEVLFSKKLENDLSAFTMPVKLIKISRIKPIKNNF